ncbi:peptide/nickel transport system permease protein [Cytobacillus horneckiae]|uniref:ABC transporter permease n=1 Tax=Cytobacillus horneckiae TaxID=549687 RepID=UPI0008251067|nr:ABC transporter permease [Cytobacillus horneckiae]NRG47161.1 ABC transporter permease [Bacillus sp. CRN 9]MBN6886148.1 ABC transporter permease [Cytobacillus horneckiae]MCM3176448.1 ABC transporter permease [Cytobacillus horneckiae]MEC1158389.1 ABC transporter permease [Cytobacillus horneckiae]MED2937338.1 ABC transporter permease [Cytobacillus horneckiae]
MIKTIFKRLLLLVFVVFGVTLITFILSNIIPGDPASMMAGQRANEETLEQVREQLGLDQPVLTQYANYMQGLLTGDLGTSIRTQKPVLDDLLIFFPATLELAVLAFLIAIVIGIPLGILAAVKKNTFWDHASRIFTISGISTPVFWSGLLVIFIFYGVLGWFPSNGRIDMAINPPTHVTGFYLLDSLLSGDLVAFQSSLRHIILPAIVLSFAQLAIITRQVRASMLEVLEKEYFRTAIANGIHGPYLLIKYGLRNALIPTITVIGVSFGALLGGAVVTETVFGWPGMGKYVVDSIAYLDFPAMMGFTVFISIGYVLINLVVDLSYYVLNPQIKE